MFSDLEITAILALLHYFLLNSPRSEFRALTKNHGLDDLDQTRTWLLTAFPKVRDGSTIKLDEFVAVHTVTKIALGNWPPEIFDTIWKTENRIAWHPARTTECAFQCGRLVLVPIIDAGVGRSRRAA